MIPTNLYPDLFPNLNVADLDVVGGAAGPGQRLVVWLQGCLKRCPGCANRPFLPERRARAVAWPRLLLELKGLDGVTFSGGEPMLQAAALDPFAAAVRRRGQTVVCYTGYTLTELRAEAGAIARLLDNVDLLIDGEYERDRPRGGLYRPSANQRVHRLSGRIRLEAHAGIAETVIRIQGGRVTRTGTLPAAAGAALGDRLAAMGIRLRPDWPSPPASRTVRDRTGGRP